TGQMITEVDEDGERAKTNVSLGKTIIADDEGSWGVRFKTMDPIAGSVMQSELSGEVSPYDIGRVEINALGNVVPTHEPEVQEPHIYQKGGHVNNPEYGCVDPDFNSPASCDILAFLLNSGVTFPGIDLRDDPFKDPNDPSGPRLPDWVIGADDRPAGIDSFNRYPGLMYWPGGQDGAAGHWSPLRFESRQETYGPWLDKGVPTDLRDRLKDIASRTECADILNAMFDELEEDGDLFSRKLDDIYMRLAGVDVEPKLSTPGVAQINKGKRVIGIVPPTSTNPKQNDAFYTKITIAESVHHARAKGMYSDKDLDNAAKLVIPGLTEQQKKKLGDIEGIKKRDKREDGYLGHTVINTFCRYSDAEVN
ncbi:MAG TPA: hypothetical protein VJV05_17570, partial [Pyrinomonadaceae bacterium]|nr:hypothetical protein [Pyrinomonadaceae bacterium]